MNPTFAECSRSRRAGSKSLHKVPVGKEAAISSSAFTNFLAYSPALLSGISSAKKLNRPAGHIDIGQHQLAAEPPVNDHQQHDAGSNQRRLRGRHERHDPGQPTVTVSSNSTDGGRSHVVGVVGVVDVVGVVAPGSGQQITSVAVWAWWAKAKIESDCAL